MVKKKGQQYYFNFINSLNSEDTKRQYIYNLQRFLSYSKLDLNKFLKLPDQKIADLIPEYLVERQVSKSTKNNIFYKLKHACEINDVILNRKKINTVTPMSILLEDLFHRICRRNVC